MPKCNLILRFRCVCALKATQAQAVRTASPVTIKISQVFADSVTAMVTTVNLEASAMLFVTVVHRTQDLIALLLVSCYYFIIIN